jgi:phage-related protein
MGLKRGIRYRPYGESEFKDSSDFNLVVKTINTPMLPSKRDDSVDILGRDGPIDFTDGYNKKTMLFRCEIKDVFNYQQRTYLIDDIVGWYSRPGELILNYRGDRVYRVKLIEQLDKEMLATYDVFELEFEAEPISESLHYNDELIWNQIETPWNQQKVPWVGYPRKFDNVLPGDEVVLNNIGNHESKPIVVLDGVAAEVIITDDSGKSFTYTGLNGVVYIDCKFKKVFSLNGQDKVNQRMNFSGSYITIQPGGNTITIGGTITNLNIEFDYKNSYKS